MKESFTSTQKTGEKQLPSEDKRVVGNDRGVLMDEKRAYLDSVKESVREMFGTDELPRELVEEMIGIRRELKGRVLERGYLDVLDDAIDRRIQRLMFLMARHGQDVGRVESVGPDAREEVVIRYSDGTWEETRPEDRELLDSLRKYFDAYRLAHNAAQFRENVSDVEAAMLGEHASRKLNFYSKSEKSEELADRVFEKYEQAGFTRQEIGALLQTCRLERLDSLEIHDLKILAKIGEIFSKFVKGDTSRYIGLSAALMVPAFLEGYAPSFLADAFRENQIDMTQVGLFALLTSVAAGSSAYINKQFKDFLDGNFSKEGGFGQSLVRNVAEFPGDEVGRFGMERIKSRIASAKESYERVLRKISFDVLPAIVTLATSAAMLYEKSPVLAGGTVASTGIMMMIDRYVDKKGKFWEKEQRASREAEVASAKMDELLCAHMEVILSGEKERFTAEMETLLSRERVAQSDKAFMEVVRDKVARSIGVLNFVTAGVATYFAGGTSDKFIAALVYSENFHSGIAKILEAKHDLLSSFRDIVQMEIMFNGYSDEETEKEKGRRGVSQLESYDIRLENVSVVLGEKKILEKLDLEIPAGSLVSLEGASGTGKTTLMKVLAGYYKPTEGSVQIGGIDVDALKKSGPDSVYSKIAYLSQFPYIIEGDVRSNVTFGVSGEIAESEIMEVLREVGLQERFPDIKERLKGGRGDIGTTSGGETSRIGLARVLLKMRKSASRIVFLDEPTASVDEETAAEIARIINAEKKENPEVTFISISHDKNFREMLDTTQVLKIRKGKIGD
jgi:ABC-type multidrug transport system fused ATPase/permease subunit